MTMVRDTTMRLQFANYLTALCAALIVLLSALFAVIQTS